LSGKLLLVVLVQQIDPQTYKQYEGSSIEDKGDNHGVSISTSMTTWRLLFLDGDIKAEMVSPQWNNFFLSLLRFIVVRSGHDEGLGRISFRFFSGRKKKKDNRKNKFLNSACMIVGCRSLASILKPFAKCLPMRSSILQSIIQVWF
jgi:hypothetical protein